MPVVRADLVVVGGGMAGLVAARRAALAGARVVVLEQDVVTGGMLRAGRLGDLVLDIGAEAFATRDGEVERLVAELGFAADVVEPRRLGSWAHADGRSYRLPAAGLLGIPADPTDGDVVDAIGADGAAIAAEDARLDPAVGLDADSLAGLVRARMGDAVVDRLVTPVARGVYSIDPADLDHRVLSPRLASAVAETGSLAAAVTTIRAAAPPGAAVRGIRGGMHRLVRALDDDLAALGVDVRTSARVASVEPDGRAWTVVLDSGERIACSAVLVTVPGVAAAVVATSPGPAAAAPTSVDEPVPAEVAAIHVADDRLDAAPRGTGLLVGEPAGAVEAKALTHVTAKWPWLHDAVPAGTHVLRLSYGPVPGAASARTRGLDDEALRARAVHDASALTGVDLEVRSVLAIARHEWRIPAPAARLGRRDRLDALRTAAARIPGFDIAGTWIDGTGLATVLPAAERAALRLLDP